MGALELKRQLEVNYKTAWLVKHKLLRVMELRDEPYKLGGRGAMNKSAFVAEVQTTQMASLCLRVSN